MDTLVAMGSGAAFVYSLAELYLMSAVQGAGDMERLMHYGHNLYFETAAMIPCLITVGKLLEAMSKGRTTDALKSLMKLAPKTAVLLRDGEEVEVDIGEVQVGDVFLVRPGENIPVDGVVLEGSSAVNEAALTGESIPVDKAEGDRLSAATLNQSGFLKGAGHARRGGHHAQPDHPHGERRRGHQGPHRPHRGPGLGRVRTGGDRHRALHARSLAAERAELLLCHRPCDRRPCDLLPLRTRPCDPGRDHGRQRPGREERHPVQDRRVAGAGRENRHRRPGQDRHHHLRRAGSDGSAARGGPRCPATGWRRSGTAGGCSAVPGSFMAGQTGDPRRRCKSRRKRSPRRENAALFRAGEELLGIIAVADTIKDDSARAVKELRGMGLEVVMLTGDNTRTAKAIGAEAGVDRVIAGVLPDGKEAEIRRLQKQGKVAMVGDGINDAPALTRADLGIAIGAGADVAIDAADVVLMKSRLTDVSAAVRLSRLTIRNIHENLFWAFFYNVICIPLAAGFYQKLFGWSWEMSPMLGAAAMSLSSFTVCMNALRLNLFDIHDPKHDRVRKKKGKTNEEETSMVKTLKVEGMMCQHCEKRVQKALEALEGVESAVASHEAGTAVVTLSAPVADEILKKAVEDQDYEVKGIE